MAVKKVLVFENSKKDEVLCISRQISQALEERGLEVTVVKLFDGKEPSVDFKNADLAVSLGGDGTVLEVSRLIEKTSIPVIGVNLGTFGYITETQVSEFNDVLDEYIAGKAKIQKRMRLCVKYTHNGNTQVQTALNDVCLGAVSHASLAKISLSINDTLASNLKCDGVIIATPTGSTAYNLSAGGPILSSDLESIVINPICPFTMGVRPLVISDKETIKMHVPDQKAKLMLCIDGREICEIESNDVVEICRAENDTYFVANSKRNNITVLREKLGWAGGFNA